MPWREERMAYADRLTASRGLFQLMIIYKGYGEFIMCDTGNH